MLKIPFPGEPMAQACENACLFQSSCPQPEIALESTNPDDTEIERVETQVILLLPTDKVDVIALNLPCLATEEGLAAEATRRS